MPRYIRSDVIFVIYVAEEVAIIKVIQEWYFGKLLRNSSNIYKESKDCLLAYNFFDDLKLVGYLDSNL